MTKLIVSVRTRHEAMLAWEAGVDLIDIKEPKQGSLGFASDAAVATIKSTLPSDVPFSVAMGELVEEFPYNPQAYSEGASFVKIGLSGCRKTAWQPVWKERFQTVAPSARPVAVIYADGERADSPTPAEILAHGHQAACGALLVDTYHKDGRTLIDLVSLGVLECWLETAGSHRMTTVLAGSLDASAIRTVLTLRPDYVAVRGAACHDGRRSTLDPIRIAELVDLVRGS